MRDVSLFVHSTGTGPAMWADVPDAVVGDSQKLSPANLGYPPLPPIARGDPCGLERETDHLERTIGQGASGVHLFAHSYGATIALLLAKRLGSRVRSLFLFEPVFFGALVRDQDADPSAVEGALALSNNPMFLLDLERGGTDEWLEMFIDYWNRPGSWARLPDLQKNELRVLGWKMFQEVRSVFFEAKDYADFPIPSVPCTLVTAEKTTKAARAMVLAMSRRHPDAQLVELPGVGHMAVLTKPAVVHSAMIAHADRVRRA